MWGSGAVNWTTLDDRMRYIIALFRSRQQDEDLRWPPFTAEQRVAMMRGEVPVGPL